MSVINQQDLFMRVCTVMTVVLLPSDIWAHTESKLGDNYSSSANYSVKLTEQSLYEAVEKCVRSYRMRISCTDVHDSSERAAVCVRSEGWRK